MAAHLECDRAECGAAVEVERVITECDAERVITEITEGGEERVITEITEGGEDTEHCA
jgi:hypothetical protein